MSERSKRREASELSTKTGNETELLVQASIMSARKEGKRELAVVLKETMESPTRFEDYCFETANHIQQKYDWLPMTPTVHKVLVHSKQIMENISLPAGYYGEDAAEARNKIYKSDRLSHARTTSRVDNFSDVFNRALDTSDPLISSLGINTRIQQRKRLNLPPEVIQLLKCEVSQSHTLYDDTSKSDETIDEEDQNEWENEEANIVLDSELFI